MALIKVLIIDDESLIRKTTALLLKKMNFETLTAGSGKEGIALAEKENPDIVLLDIMMPEMDGWSVLAHFKADTRLAKIPIVVFTAKDFSLSDRMARDRGAVAICRKPFQPDQLMTIIKDVQKEVEHGQ
jgi:two-component system, sensor histidine kinase and response regulator